MSHERLKGSGLLAAETNARSSSRIVEKNSVNEYVFTVSVARIVLWVRSIRPRHRRMFGFGIDVHENTIHKDAIW
jgi:hypothetical protein